MFCMNKPVLSATAGYAENAAALIEQYERLTFEEVHREVLSLFPVRPGRVLDIGAGTGRDAAALAARGHMVTAVELASMACFRSAAAGARTSWAGATCAGLSLALRAAGELSAVTAPVDPARKFDASRAGEYEQQSRIALAGYDACHELAACMLSATLGSGTTARVLVAGAGGGAREIITAGALEPGWRFTAVDPSRPMMELAVARLTEHGLLGRTEVVLGTVDDLSSGEPFDAATLIGVLHHLHGDEAKRAILRAIAERLRPGAALVLAGNHYAYASQPLLLAAWGERWRQQGASADEVEAKRGKILQGADPPHSEEVVAELLRDAGFEPPTRFFSSLFWGAWITRRQRSRT